MSIEQAFINIWQWIYDFGFSLLNGLNSILISNDITSLNEIDISFRLLSDSPIFTLDLFTLLLYITLFILAYFIYKVLRGLIRLPLRYFGVIR